MYGFHIYIYIYTYIHISLSLSLSPVGKMSPFPDTPHTMTLQGDGWNMLKHVFICMYHHIYIYIWWWWNICPYYLYISTYMCIYIYIYIYICLFIYLILLIYLCIHIVHPIWYSIVILIFPKHLEFPTWIGANCGVDLRDGCCPILRVAVLGRSGRGNLWRFPKMGGYPHFSSILIVLFDSKPSSYWGTPF